MNTEHNVVDNVSNDSKKEEILIPISMEIRHMISLRLRLEREEMNV